MAFWQRRREGSKAMADSVEERTETEAGSGSAESDKLLRLQADFDNYRRRNATARAEAAADARREILGELLGVYDNLLRARDHAAEAPPEAVPYLEGFDAIRAQFEQFLRAQGLEEIEAVPGVPFDPEVHEAVAMVPAAGEGAEGTIAEVIRKGFSFKGSVVRPATVLVHAGEAANE